VQPFEQKLEDICIILNALKGIAGTLSVVHDYVPPQRTQFHMVGQIEQDHIRKLAKVRVAIAQLCLDVGTLKESMGDLGKLFHKLEKYRTEYERQEACDAEMAEFRREEAALRRRRQRVRIQRMASDNVVGVSDDEHDYR